MDLRELKDKASQLFAKGKFARAAEAYQEYCQADSKDLQSRLRLGDAWAKAGKKDQAITAYTWAAEVSSPCHRGQQARPRARPWPYRRAEDPRPALRP